MKYDVCIIGGCGHIGLPLGLAFADKNMSVVLYDIDQRNVNLVNKGKMPFKEEFADKLLLKLLRSKKISATNDKQFIRNSKTLVLTVDTPFDGSFNPVTYPVMEVLKQIKNYVKDNQLLVLRSTLYPGVTKRVVEFFEAENIKIHVAYCPERTIEGHALQELRELPQIIAGYSVVGTKKATSLFKKIAKKTIITDVLVAELAKLMTNTWRYIHFSISNQFYMIAEKNGINFNYLQEVMKKEYPRLKSFTRAGLVGGPCLEKDALQLSAFAKNSFPLGNAALLINKGMPAFIATSIDKKYNLSNKVVAIIGMAFKGNSDDSRKSPSYELLENLRPLAKEVLCHDFYIKDPSFVTLEKISKDANIVILAVAHKKYKNKKWGNAILIDIENFYEKNRKDLHSLL